MTRRADCPGLRYIARDPVKNESFPSVAQALLLVLALFLGEYVLGAALHDLRRMLALSREEISALVTLLGNGVLFSVLLYAKALPYRALFHPSSASVRATILLLVPPVALLIPALVLLAGELNNFLLGIFPISAWERQAFESMASGSVPAVTAVCLLAPVIEEMLFRGVFLRSFLAQYPRGMAIGASALIFGVAHLNVYQFAIAFVLGLIAGWLYERSRSLIPCIALHALYNTSVVMGEASSNGGMDLANAASTGTWAFSLLAALAGVLALKRLLGQASGRTAA